MSEDAVLVVEDDAATAELERRALSRSGLRAQIVSRVGDALIALRARPFAAVLLDYQLPDGDPWRVVEVANSCKPRVPVILVTASGNERVAVEAIHRGVSDYLRKADTFWEQLPQMVNRVKRLASAEEQLRRTDAVFRLIGERGSDLILVADGNGILQSVSAASRVILGYDPDELIGRSGYELLLLEASDSGLAGDDGGQPSRLLKAKRRDGTPVWLESNAYASRDASGQVIELVAVVRDVTERTLAQERLQKQQAQLEEAQRIAQIGSWEWDIGSNLVTWSDELFRIFGCEPRTFGGTSEAYLGLVLADERSRVRETLRAALTTSERFCFVHRVTRGDGAVRSIESRGRTTFDRDGKPLRMSGTAQDVTAREEQQARLKESDAFFDLSLELLSTASVDGFFKRVSPAFKILGYTEEELTTTPFLEFVHPEDVAATLAEVGKLKQGIKTLHFENRYRCKDGSYRWISWTSTPDPNGMLYGTGRDITEQRAAQAERERLTRQLEAANQQLEIANAQLKRSLREREVLLQEIHHRVKNNLQVISSLINLQVRKLERGGPRDALTECQTRISAIALIHEKLYESADYSRLSFADYARGLVAGVLRTAQGADGPVRLELLLEDIELPVDQAIPCGLVLSELVTNCLKYAFEDGRSGIIRVEFARGPGARLRLAVADDGPGFPRGFALDASPSLGLQLVRTLAEQLDGEVEACNRSGARVQLEFPGPDPREPASMAS